VISFEQDILRSRRRMAVAVGCVVLAAAVLGASWMASAQEQSETMISTGKIDLADAHEHADTISIMFMAFPHLFPPSSNQWKPNADLDPATDTFASPDAWTKFSDFYQRATAASKTAYDMSRADKVDELKTRTKELRVACDGCHAAYLKTQ
jgi:cytochrome c556